MGFLAPNQRSIIFRPKSIAVPGPWLVSNLPVHPRRRVCPAIVRREFCLQRWEAGHIANREDIVRDQHVAGAAQIAATIRPERWNCLTFQPAGCYRENTLRL